MELIKEIKNRADASSQLIAQALKENQEKLKTASEKIADSLRQGGKVFFFGNGGSASQAQHFSAEFVNRMVMERAPLPAIALTTDTSILTSVGNDRGFEQIFSIQLRALGKKEDIAVGISTSGNSENVILALEEAGRLGMFRIGFAGRGGSRIGKVTDLCFWVESPHTPRIQEVHLALGHILCEMVELILFGKENE